MKLLGLSGKARSGKDTVADYLVKHHNWIKVSLATSLKYDVMDQFDFSQSQVFGAYKDVVDPRYLTTPRQKLIEYGAAKRAVDANYWIKRLVERIQLVPQAQKHTYVIPDVRFVNEADWIKRHGGIVVRLNRSIKERGINIDDPSETSLDNWSGFDLVVDESLNVDVGDIPKIARQIYDRVKGLFDHEAA